MSVFILDRVCLISEFFKIPNVSHQYNKQREVTLCYSSSFILVRAGEKGKSIIVISMKIPRFMRGWKLLEIMKLI